MAHKAQQDFCQQVKERFPEKFRRARVLDVGSLDINGSNRWMFDEPEVLHGIDLGPGHNVDEVCHVTEWERKFSPSVVVSTEALEHDSRWRESLRRMVNILEPGGLLLITCASKGRREHGTHQSVPSCSPHTLDYYGNLDERDFRTVVDFGEEFSSYEFRDTGVDLQFWGIKASGKTLQFWVDGGLCNRFQVALSALGWCRDNGYLPRMFWEKRLRTFPPPGAVEPFETPGHNPALFAADIYDLYDWPGDTCNREEWEDNTRSGYVEWKGNLPPSPGFADKVYGGCFHGWWGQLSAENSAEKCLSLCPLIKPLQDRVRKFLLGCVPRSALIVRTQATPKNWMESLPVDAAIGWVRKFASIHGAPVYLCCDNKGWTEKILNATSGLAVCESMPPEYNTVEAIQKAAVELSIMGECEEVHSTYGTSMVPMTRLYRRMRKLYGNEWEK